MRGLPPSLRFLRSIPVATFALAGVSCSTGGASAPAGDVHLEPTIVAPEGLINEIRVFSVDVYRTKSDGGATVACDPSGSGKLSASSAVFDTPIASSDSASGSCDGGAMRCFQLKSVPNSAIPDVFYVVGYADAAMKNPIAYGCQQFTLAPVADGGMSTYAFTIPLVPVEICGDGMIEPPETCDPSVAAGPTTEACRSCQTGPDLLSSGSGASGSITTTGAPGDKRDPFFLWPTGGDFLAFFSDDSTNAAGSEQISMRIRDGNFAPTATPSTVTETESIYVPDELSGTASSFPPPAEADDHKQPVAVQIGNYTHIVFADDAAGPFSIVLRVMDAGLNAQQASPCAVSDASGGESGSLTSPSVAVSTIGGSQVMFIAWQDDSGRIYGRTYTPGASGACGTLGTQTLLSTTSGNSHVSVAGTSNGWIATWASSGAIELRPVGKTGAPTNPAIAIQASGHLGADPVIASLGTGSFAVAWADQVGTQASSIYAQRYAANDGALDTPTQVSVSSNGGEASPAIAASTAVGGSYVVAWVDTGGTQEVRARLLSGASSTSLATQTGTNAGYLHNTIDGTTGEFVVSEVYPTTSTLRTRVSPTVAVGGGGFMAFGWADNSTTGNSTTSPFGIIGRRFPLPTE